MDFTQFADEDPLASQSLLLLKLCRHDGLIQPLPKQGLLLYYPNLERFVS